MPNRTPSVVSTRSSPSCSAQSTSCASSPTASIRPCSATKAWPPRSTRSPSALPHRCASRPSRTSDTRHRSSMPRTESWPTRSRPAPPGCASQRRDTCPVCRGRHRSGTAGSRRARRPRRSTRRMDTGRGPTRRGRAAAVRDPVRVVLADDSMLLREGLARLLVEAGFDVVGKAEHGERAPPPRRARRTRCRHRRHQDAAHPHGRRHRRRTGDPPNPPDRRCARALPVPRVAICDPPARRRPRAGRLPPQGACLGHRRAGRRAAADQ